MTSSPTTIGLRQRAYRVLPLSLLARLMPRRVTSLHYHVVSSQPLPHVRQLYDYKSPAQFEDDLRYLGRHFRLIGYGELVEVLSDPAPAARGRPVAFLSFDDGYRECHDVVRPILLRHGVPCTFFLTTGFLDNALLFHRNQLSLCIEAATALSDAAAADVQRQLWPDRTPGGSARDTLRRQLRALRDDGPAVKRACELLTVDVDRFLDDARPYLTREQVRTLDADGFTIGAHSRTHPVLDDRMSEERLEWEVAGSCDDVRALTGSPQVPFAFPVSGRGVDRDRLERLRARHAVIGLLFDTGQLRRDRPFIVHRIPAERPRPAVPPGRSNVPDHLRRAYVNQAGRSVLDVLSRAVGAQ